MRWSVAAVAIAVVAASVRAEPARVTVVTKDGRHSGTLDVASVEVDAQPRTVKVPWADVAFIQFGDTDAVRTRQGRRVKGAVRAEGWTLAEGDAPRPLSKSDLKYLIPQVPLGQPRKGQVVDAASAAGMAYHVRLPEKYDPAAGRPAIVLLHGSNANSADYVLGVAQRWPKLAADYVLIGIDGEWPVQKDPDVPPAFNYTYVNFVGKSKYKGFPGSDRESPALVAETLAEIRKQLKLTKVFVTGHSQGGFLAYSCLMNYPDVFDGAMPISAGLIFQCEPTAYEDEAVRQAQRERPLAILHGDRDPLVNVSMGRSAYESFLADGFPMLRLFLAKGAGHAFIALPFEDGVRWLESMTSSDPKALAAFAQQAFARRDYRDAVAYLDRAKEVEPAGKESASAAALRKKIEQLASGPAGKLEAAIRGNQSGAWVSDFESFRRDFEFTDAAAGVMAEYGKLRKAHEPAAAKLWAEARQAFQKGDQEQGNRKCEEIVGKYYASSTYRYARQALDERRN
jgi:pimeloyl-ACP methyl ester carboxylesterase